MDIYADWYHQSEVDEDGCVLVRPDMHVAWRAKNVTPSASDSLRDVFARILQRKAGSLSVAAE
jgi:2,4-dichlorophenol 6-monooxygenase